MPRHFARHEQFLRIFALLDILSAAHHPLDDQSLITAIKDRLGLMRLSPRTLRRDCDFLTSCGYAVDHVPLPDGRRLGWALAKDAVNGRRIPAEPLTLLELAAVYASRELLAPFEGTVLWTGMQSLKSKLERDTPQALNHRADGFNNVLHVRNFDQRYALRPRLLSTLMAAITDGQEIEITTDGQPSAVLRVHPHFVVLDPTELSLLAFPADGGADASHMLIDLRRVQKVTPLDSKFVRRDIDPDSLLD